jgi:hypothetical protein
VAAACPSRSLPSLHVLWRGLLPACLNDLALRLLLPRLSAAIEHCLDYLVGPYTKE